MLSNRSRLAVPAILCLALAFAGQAKADPILLFNTGVDSGGALLPGGTPDPHYDLISSPDPSLATAFVSDLIPNSYIPNGPDSKWIGPGVDLTLGYPAGIYIYRTTFDLTGFDPTTAVITGNFASDNDASILLNGASTGIGSPFNGFGSFTSFTISSGFVSGLNTLDFRVSEAGGSPTALRVELSGTVQVRAVPEPSSLALIASGGIAGLGLWRRRRKQIA